MNSPIVADSNSKRRKQISSRLAGWNFSCAAVENETALWQQLAKAPNSVVLLGLPQTETVLQKLILHGHPSVIVLLDEDKRVFRAVGRGSKQETLWTSSIAS